MQSKGHLEHQFTTIHLWPGVTLKVEEIRSLVFIIHISAETSAGTLKTSQIMFYKSSAASL